MKPRMFVASSAEGLPIARAIHSNLDRDLEVTIWEHRIFVLSQCPMESLLKKLSNTEFAAFVFTADDVLKMREQEHRVARDNVVFELGLAIGKLGRERCFIVKPRVQEMHLPSDLVGLTPGDFDNNRQDKNLAAALGPFCDAVRQAVAEVGNLEPKTQAPEKRIFEATQEEVTLLTTLCDSSSGFLYYFKYNGGFELQIDNIQLVGEADIRSRAQWREAVERLLEYGFLRDSDGRGEMFELTTRGHDAVEQVRNLQGREVLSADAAALLIAALRVPKHQCITRQSSNMGIRFHAGGKQFGEPGDTRSQARWIAAFDELYGTGLIDDQGSGQVFSISQKGYQVGDEMRTNRKRLIDRLNEGAKAVLLCTVFMEKKGIAFPRYEYQSAQEREEALEEAKELEKLRCAEQRQDGVFYITSRGLEVAQWISDELDDDFRKDLESRSGGS